MKDLIEYTDFTKVHIAAGTILEAKINEKARKPAYVLTIDFGAMGVKQSSAQITDHYQPNDLVGRQIVAVVNFPAKRVAGIKSEVLVLGSVDKEHKVTLLQPERNVENGERIL